MRLVRRAAAVCLAGMLLSAAPAVRAQDNVSSQIEVLKQQVQDLQNKLEALEKAQAEQAKQKTERDKAVEAAVSDVHKMKKIKVSGYIQARYEDYQTPAGISIKGDNKAPDNRFYVRRARFKFTGQPSTNTLGVLQLDVSGYDRTKVETKDIYIEYHPWGVGARAPFLVRLGQQNWPFGYIVERSSSAREVPERAKVFSGVTASLPFNGLFPGERDKGIALFSTETSKTDWALGLFNGTGTKPGDAGTSFLENGGRFEDNNSAKTIVGRIRYPFADNLKVGTSIYSGSQAVRTVSNAVTAKTVSQTRWGADAQYYMQGASLKAEYVTGKEPYYSNPTTTPNTTSGTNRTVSGWYVVGVKNVGTKYQAVAQYDVLDDRGMTTYGKIGTWNLGVVRFLDEATRAKLIYEINKEEKKSVSNNGLRFEVISVF